MEIVDPLLLYKLPHLQLLDLSLNKLHWALCPTIYRRMNFTSRLQILDFSSNNVITTLQVEFFYCLTYLQKLSLNSCGIQRIERLAFSGLHNLKVLNLKGNNIKTLVIVNLGITLKDISQDDAQYLFQNLAKLEIMHLMSSGLEYISAVLFQDLKNLRLLILEDDLLLTLDSGFQNEMMLLKYLYLARVTFGCYCSNAWFVDWVSGKNDLYVAIDYELSCQELITAKKTKKFLPFVEQNCRVKTNLILFIITSFLLFFLMSFPLVHACCGPQLFFLIYLLRGWWHRLCGEIGKGKKFKYDAFVSYCSQDQEWVLERLVPNLEQKGPSFLKLCLHSRDFAVGKAITDNIMDNLYNSQKTICVISQRSLCSHWCSLEMSLATYRLLAGREDTLILVFLEHISRYRLSSYHRLAKLMKKKTYLNWPKDPAAEPAFWNRLRNAIKKHCDVEESVM
ncbi:toll-like receptor 12 [Eublepharis macularius]|uniref:Toll-like receptor 12 n=1 Tax=Eublepharis macularius TaxID=481883 RepID=A0AA97LBF7_EUBMA|nr:toll-like receptor 12 [Eublepharis macularius]